MLDTFIRKGHGEREKYKTILFAFQFPEANISLTKFNLVFYAAKDHHQAGDSSKALTLEPSGFTPSTIESKNLIFGNLDMNIGAVLKAIVDGKGEIDPDFDHIELSPAIDEKEFGRRLYYKADVIMLKEKSSLVLPPSGSYNANPSPPAAPSNRS